jgi:hypothetical protein
MGERKLRGGGLGVVAVLCLALASLLAPGAAFAATRTVYVGDSEEYSVAFKAEAGRVYVLELAGTADCYYSEPREDLGPVAFSAFPAPTLMREGRRGLVAGESSGDGFGLAHVRVRVNLGDDAATGGLSFNESEESFHCDTGSSEVPFEAGRYGPIGTPGVTTPARGEIGAYYGSRGPIEVFLRTPGNLVGGIRGTFVSRCPVGRKGRASGPRPLFSRPEFAKRKKGRFRRRAKVSGRTRSGVPFRESVRLVGRVRQGAVTGTYLRVRTTTPAHRPARRCRTGPLRFRAVRYLPVG